MQHLAKQWRGRNKNKLKPANRLKMNMAKTNRPKKEKKKTSSTGNRIPDLQSVKSSPSLLRNVTNCSKTEPWSRVCQELKN